jgi:hypothetical protein
LRNFGKSEKLGNPGTCTSVKACNRFEKTLSWRHALRVGSITQDPFATTMWQEEHVAKTSHPAEQTRSSSRSNIKPARTSRNCWTSPSLLRSFLSAVGLVIIVAVCRFFLPTVSTPHSLSDHTTTRCPYSVHSTIHYRLMHCMRYVFPVSTPSRRFLGCICLLFSR